MQAGLAALGLDPYDYFAGLQDNELWIAGGAVLVVIVVLLLLPARRQTSMVKPWRVALAAVLAISFGIVVGDLWSAVVDRVWP